MSGRLQPLPRSDPRVGHFEPPAARPRLPQRLEVDVVGLPVVLGVERRDARFAIGILRTAAGKADRENHERITDDILLDAAEDVRA